MSMYVCTRCNAVENTALTLYWSKVGREPVLCSGCERGEWHGMFAKEQYDPAKHDGVRLLASTQERRDA